MKTLRFRAKLYYAVAGAELTFSVIASAAGALYLAGFAFVIAYVSWFLADVHTEESLKNEGGQDE